MANIFIYFLDSRLRCHGREEFINKSEVVGLDYPVFSPTSKMIKDLFDSMEENRGHGRHDRYANEFMESSKFMVSADIPLDIKKLEGATNQLYEWIDKDQDYSLCSNIVERLVQIFDYSDIQYIQYLAISILSSARYHGCSKVINEKAIPVLVKLINHPSSQFAKRVVITLTRLALASSDHIPVIVDNGALEAAEKFVLNSESGVYYVVHYLARLLVVVCRTNNLKPDKEKIAISISQSILENKFYSSTTIHIKRACYALSYLSYGKYLEITDAVCESLVKFLSHDDESVVASAFGVVGNIVRWGNVDQIQYLVGHCRLLECLGKSLLCSEHKKFRKGACQLISNVAVLSKTSIKDEAGLIESLCKLLEKDEYVKTEAEWAIINCTYAS